MAIYIRRDILPQQKNMFYEHENEGYIEIYVCGAIYNKEKRKGWHLKRVLGHKCKDLHTHT